MQNYTAHQLCIICDHPINIKDGLLKHLDTHKNDELFECPDCAANFNDLASFKDHIIVIDNYLADIYCGSSKQNVEVIPEPIAKNPDNPPLSYNSPSDKQQIENKDRKELRSKSPITNSPNLKEQTNTLFICVTCNKSFRKKSTLKTHEKLHLGKRDFQCDYCGRQFFYAGNLKVHLLKHTGNRPFECTICGKTFRSSSNRSEHVKFHDDDRIECSICGKWLANPSSLAKHRQIHTGEKSHVCQLCGQTFRQMVHLKKHLGVHSGEKPFKCDSCGRFFVRKDVLAVHRRRYHAKETG